MLLVAITMAAAHSSAPAPVLRPFSSSLHFFFFLFFSCLSSFCFSSYCFSSFCFSSFCLYYSCLSTCCLFFLLVLPPLSVLSHHSFFQSLVLPFAKNLGENLEITRFAVLYVFCCPLFSYAHTHVLNKFPEDIQDSWRFFAILAYLSYLDFSGFIQISFILLFRYF